MLSRRFIYVYHVHQNDDDDDDDYDDDRKKSVFDPLSNKLFNCS